MEVAAGQDHYKAHSEELVLGVINVEAVLQAEGLADLQLVIRGKDQELINPREASKDKALTTQALEISLLLLGIISKAQLVVLGQPIKNNNQDRVMTLLRE